MKTIKMTVRHGETLETATATGATVHEAIYALKSQQRLGGYVIDNTREAYPAFAATLETSGRAQHGWGDYEIVKEDAPAHTPEPWEVWRFENANDDVSIGAKSGGVSVCEIIMRDGGGWANANTIQRGNDNAARIVACVNACDGIANEKLALSPMDAADVHTRKAWAAIERQNAEIKALRDALAAAVQYLEKHRPKGKIQDIFSELNEYENGVMKPARAAIARATGEKGGR